MNRKKFLTAGAMVVLVVGLMAGAMGTALASPGNGAIFELDASLDLSNGSSPKAAITDNATTNKPDDWDRVCHTATASATTPQCTTAANDHATARSFDSETTATGSANNATIFTGGGSKDQQPTGSWAWKDASGGLPDKDNLLHAMTARYDGTNSYIFFAADRFDNSGDAQIGFWFFNNTVGPLAGGSFGPGSHKAGVVPHDPAHSGDILILSDFTNGGTQPTIRIFEYVGSGGSDGSLNLLGGSTDDIRDCGSVPTDDFCGSVNNLDGAAVPWLFLNKSGQSSFGHGEFYEGGLNLNFLGLQNECFASFLAETRSSQSVTATLKDFVGGSFQNCSATAVTTPSSTSVSPGTPVTDTILITGAGPALPPFPSSPPNVFFSYCGPIAAPATCGATTTAISNNALSNTATQGVSTATSSAINTAANPLAPGRYCFKATWAGDANYPLGASDSGVNECFTVTDTTSASSVQNWLPNDSATITATGGTALSGSLTIQLYTGGTCGVGSGSAVSGQLYTFTLSNEASGTAHVTSNTTFKVTATGTSTVSWLETFTSSNPNVGNSSHCESTTLTITN
jgi:hypothetical protein